MSIDTTKAAVARVALVAGAAVVNDQWGLQRDPAMASVVADGEAGLVCMHNRVGIDATLDIMDDMHRFFDRSLALAEAAGIPRTRIILDPGIGLRQEQGAESGRAQRRRNATRFTACRCWWASRVNRCSPR